MVVLQNRREIKVSKIKIKKLNVNKKKNISNHAKIALVIVYTNKVKVKILHTKYKVRLYR